MRRHFIAAVLSLILFYTSYLEASSVKKHGSRSRRKSPSEDSKIVSKDFSKRVSSREKMKSRSKSKKNHSVQRVESDLFSDLEEVSSLDDDQPTRKRVVSSRRSRSKLYGPTHQIKIPVIDTGVIAAALKMKIEMAKGKLSAAHNMASSTGNKLTRKIKMFTSGTWEAALLKATWPDDKAPDSFLVDQIVYGVKQFDLNNDVTKNSAEHRVFLRKLWAKMLESDWQTKVKSCYILHRVVMELPQSDDAVLKLHMNKLKREKGKRTKSGSKGPLCFDMNALVNPLQVDHNLFEKFAERYASFVIRRTQQFGKDYREVEKVKEGRSYEYFISTLVKLQKILELGLQCKIAVDMPECELSLSALQLLCLDLSCLFRAFHEALIFALSELKDGTLFEGANLDAASQIMNDFKELYNRCHQELDSFFGEVETTLELWDLKCGDLSLSPVIAETEKKTEIIDETEEKTVEDSPRKHKNKISSPRKHKNKISSGKTKKRRSSIKLSKRNISVPLQQKHSVEVDDIPPDNLHIKSDPIDDNASVSLEPQSLFEVDVISVEELENKLEVDATVIEELKTENSSLSLEPNQNGSLSLQSEYPVEVDSALDIEESLKIIIDDDADRDNKDTTKKSMEDEDEFDNAPEKH